MNKGIKITKGLDLHIAGAIAAPDAKPVKKAVGSVAVVPDDFPGLTLKPAVKEGDKVLIGSPLLVDKAFSDVKIISPVAGTVKAIVRGERRKILRVEVETNAETSSLAYNTAEALKSADNMRALLQNAGLWAMMRQRPYDIVLKPDAKVRDFYVTGFDSAPLAWNPTAFTPEQVAAMQAGVKALKMLTEGNVYVSRRANQQIPDLDGAIMLTVEGPHPAGNASSLIAATSPVNKGEVVATLSLCTLCHIGTLINTANVPTSTIVAITGSEAKDPKLVECPVGAKLSDILAGEIAETSYNLRVISGNVLTGIAVNPADDYLRRPYTQITIIPEGDHADEFMGWASLSPNKMSISRSFPSRLLGLKRLFKPDARLLGGRRAMIMSGEFDRVMPLDILPEYLLKAIIARQVERMEELGIYEVAPEDFALAEYVDTSKMELQKIVAEGLAFLRKELE